MYIYVSMYLYLILSMYVCMYLSIYIYMYVSISTTIYYLSEKDADRDRDGDKDRQRETHACMLKDSSTLVKGQKYKWANAAEYPPKKSKIPFATPKEFKKKTLQKVLYSSRKKRKNLLPTSRNRPPANTETAPTLLSLLPFADPFAAHVLVYEALSY